MRRTDYSNETPTYENDVTKWYVHKEFQPYIQNEQAFNLPKLKGIGCFVVKGDGIDNLVLIDHKQNILGSYPNTSEGEGQMKAKINIIKISKHYDDVEKINVQ